MVVGRLIDELVVRSHRDGGYRHYYDIALVGYSGERVYSLLGDELTFYPITMLAGREVPRTTYALGYRTLQSDRYTFQEEVSLWVQPRAEGATPMYKVNLNDYVLVNYTVPNKMTSSGSGSISGSSSDNLAANIYENNKASDVDAEKIMS